MRTTARSTLVQALAAAWVAATCTGCPAKDVLVAEQDAGPEAAPPEGGPATCSTNFDCPDGIAFCAKTSCEATTGVCQARPDTCDNAEEEYCGCDGVRYWNQCLWQR